jgi:hypothetical protein
VTLVCDTGGLVALERGDRAMWIRLKAALLSGQPPRTHAGVLAQAWRGGAGRQARLAAAVASIDVLPLTEELAKATGTLLGASSTADIVDAAVVLIASDDDSIITSDPVDIANLAAIAGRYVDVVPT